MQAPTSHHFVHDGQEEADGASNLLVACPGEPGTTQ